MCNQEDKGLETVENWSAIGHLYQCKQKLRKKPTRYIPVNDYVWGTVSKVYCRKILII